MTVTQLGSGSLRYGLGLHPWFPRSAGTCPTTSVRGVWLSGADPLPTSHTEAFPKTWDLRDRLDPKRKFLPNSPLD